MGIPNLTGNIYPDLSRRSNTVLRAMAPDKSMGEIMFEIRRLCPYRAQIIEKCRDIVLFTHTIAGHRIDRAFTKNHQIRAKLQQLFLKFSEWRKTIVQIHILGKRVLIVQTDINPKKRLKKSGISQRFRNNRGMILHFAGVPGQQFQVISMFFPSLHDGNLIGMVPMQNIHNTHDNIP